MLFDHTLDNMSLMEDGNGAGMSELLREKGLTSRSRFISDVELISGRKNSFFVDESDIPDKSYDDSCQVDRKRGKLCEEEESKAPLTPSPFASQLLRSPPPTIPHNGMP